MAIDVRVVEEDEYQPSEVEIKLDLWTTRLAYFVGLSGVVIGAVVGLNESRELAIPFRVLIALVTSLIVGGLLYWVASIFSFVVSVLYWMAPVLKIILLAFVVGCGVYFAVDAVY